MSPWHTSKASPLFFLHRSGNTKKKLYYTPTEQNCLMPPIYAQKRAMSFQNYDLADLDLLPSLLTVLLIFLPLLLLALRLFLLLFLLLVSFFRIQAMATWAPTEELACERHTMVPTKRTPFTISLLGLSPLFGRGFTTTTFVCSCSSLVQISSDGGTWAREG
jgi:hypothetical protein